MKPRFERPTVAEDEAIHRGIQADPDNPEWTEADFARARPAATAVPEVVAAHAQRTRGPQRRPTKVLVSLRIERDVLDRLRASGPGWQSRASEMLRRAVEG